MSFLFHVSAILFALVVVAAIALYVKYKSVGAAEAAVETEVKTVEADAVKVADEVKAKV